MGFEDGIKDIRDGKIGGGGDIKRISVVTKTCAIAVVVCYYLSRSVSRSPLRSSILTSSDRKGSRVVNLECMTWKAHVDKCGGRRRDGSYLGRS